MPDWGWKVAPEGVDVLTAADKDLVYSTKYNGMKIFSHGYEASAGNMAHGVGYTPAFLNYLGFGGQYRIESVLYTMDSTYANGTNINFTTTDNYYFVFVDRVAGVTALDAAGPLDWGIKVSKDGVDVRTANKDQLLMSSKYPMFKIKTQGSTNLKMYKTTLSSGINGSTTTIPLTSTTGIPTGLTGTMYVWVGGSTAWESISYTTVGGGNLSGGVRDYKGWLGGGVAHNAGDTVVVGYNEFSITHGLGYPPVHWVFLEGNAYNGDKMIIPAFFDEFGFISNDAWVTTTKLYITVQYDDFDLSPAVPAGTYDQWDYKYIWMVDSITSPYY